MAPHLFLIKASAFTIYVIHLLLSTGRMDGSVVGYLRVCDVWLFDMVHAERHCLQRRRRRHSSLPLRHFFSPKTAPTSLRKFYYERSIIFTPLLSVSFFFLFFFIAPAVHRYTFTASHTGN